ncbi:MAG: ABC transporter substrate-binding protein, partial [Frankia sp.]
MLIVAAGCGSSASSGGGTSTTGGKTFTIGLLTDVTGPASSGNKSSIEGVKAGTFYAARNGYTIKYVVGDTTSSPTATLAVAQKFVTQDHVSAVIAISSLTFGASAYLTAHNVPVVGAGEDGPEWITSKNMFSVFGALHTTKVATTSGKFFKSQGVTNLAAIGYSVSPISS